MTIETMPALVSAGQVKAEVNGALGVITLNRPEALNALNLPMVRDLTPKRIAMAMGAALGRLAPLPPCTPLVGAH